MSGSLRSPCYNCARTITTRPPPPRTDSANASVALKPCLPRNYIRVMITSDVAGCGCPLPETDGSGQRSGGEWGAFTLFACIMKADRGGMYQVNLLLRYATLVVIFFVCKNSLWAGLYSTFMFEARRSTKQCAKKSRTSILEFFDKSNLF